jgi:hypothetical protein
MVSNKSSSRLESAEQIPLAALLARDADARLIVSSRLEIFWMFRLFRAGNLPVPLL